MCVFGRLFSFLVETMQISLCQCLVYNFEVCGMHMFTLHLGPRFGNAANPPVRPPTTANDLLRHGNLLLATTLSM